MHCMQHTDARVHAVPLFVLAVCTLAACTSSSQDVDPDAAAAADAAEAPSAGECTVTAPTECPEPPVRYADVEPIFQDRCVSCHVGARGGPWALTSYSHAASWFAEIRGVMLACSMPPLDAGIEMPDEERELILTWIRCGYPE
jgi:uncharacterized membrane protein